MARCLRSLDTPKALPDPTAAMQADAAKEREKRTPLPCRCALPY